MDIESAIKRIIKTGKIIYGNNNVLKSLTNDKIKLLIVSKNIPRESKDKIEQYSKISETPIYTYRGTSLDLGEVCGKPFLISSLAVIDEGDVNISEFTKGTKE